MRSCRARTRGHSRPAGQALVEFALGATLFLLLLLAVIQFALLYHAKLVLDHASREGVRYAATRASTGAVSDADIKNWIIGRAVGLNPPLQASDITITPSEGEPRQPGQPIRVTLRYDVRPSVPLIAPLLPSRVTFSADSEMRME